MSTDRQETCEERIVRHMSRRIAQINAMRELSEYGEGDELERAALDILEERGFNIADAREDDVRDAGYEALGELPLGVSTYTIHRIDLSTGGPGDWIELVTDDEGNVIRGSYHFNDWLDHAERPLTGSELEAAEALGRRVVPALIE